MRVRPYVAQSMAFKFIVVEDQVQTSQYDQHYVQSHDHIGLVLGNNRLVLTSINNYYIGYA